MWLLKSGNGTKLERWRPRYRSLLYKVYCAICLHAIIVLFFLIFFFLNHGTIFSAFYEILARLAMNSIHYLYNMYKRNTEHIYIKNYAPSIYMFFFQITNMYVYLCLIQSGFMLEPWKTCRPIWLFSQKKSYFFYKHK